ncbi:MAG: hypothetical protein HND51_19535 [Chloroflexi bacterium]|nr:hypothetical protein [Chloroflexota bacterium]
MKNFSKKKSWKNSKRNWKKSKAFLPLPILILFITILLSACGGQDARQGQEDFFIPPTLAPQSSPITRPTATEIATNTPEVPCTNGLSFIDDATVEDGTIFFAGEEIDKRWLVENTGTCNWAAGYTIQMTDGIPMGAETTQALFPARSGSEAELAIIFTAPNSPGTYRSAWQAYDPEGNAFGDPFFMEIQVQVPVETGGDS